MVAGRCCPLLGGKAGVHDYSVAVVDVAVHAVLERAMTTTQAFLLVEHDLPGVVVADVEMRDKGDHGAAPCCCCTQCQCCPAPAAVADEHLADDAREIKP